MQATYHATFRDKFGQESTSITNDGKTLQMVVRGVTFLGSDFDGLEPVCNPPPDQLPTFNLQKGELCSCVIETEMPMPMSTPHSVIEGKLAIRLELGDPLPNGGIDRETLLLQLKFEDHILRSRGLSGWFEGELLDIQSQLPPHTFMKACISCAFSDYHPAGHGSFGGLACFRDNKPGYAAVKTKPELAAIWNTMTEFVQETYLCPEFERRTPGTGYRG